MSSDLSSDALPHESAVGHVTGTAHYVDDQPMPDTLVHVALGVSNVSAGKLKSLNLDAVRTAKGVRDVVTARDIPGDNEIGAVFKGDPLLAEEQIDYQGQPLFAVAADSLREALQAVRLAQIDIEQEPPLLDVRESLAKNDFVLPSKTWVYNTPDKIESAHTLTHQQYVRGQEHFYLEGQVATATPDDRGGMTVQSSTQHPDEIQHHVAGVLGLAMHQVRVTSPRMGGAFGGKESQAAGPACLASLFAQRLNRPAKVRLPRADDMRSTGKRHDFDTRYTVGYDDQGLLESADIELLAMCGYSPDLSDGIAERAMFHATNAYFVPHARISGHRCRTNTVSNTAFRGFGGPQGMLGMEATLDALAWQLGIDPLDVRKRNLLRPGAAELPYGQTLTQFVLGDLIEELERTSDYRNRQRGVKTFNEANTRHKRGLSLTPVQFGISFTATHLNQAGALLQVYRDGTVDVNHAGTEMGQGLHTKVRQIVATAFGINPNKVLHSATQTDKVPNGSPTAASSGSDMNGMAALIACQTIKSRLQDFAEQELGWPKTPLIFADDRVTADGNSLEFAQFIASAYRARVSLSTTGYYKTPDIHFDKEIGKGHPFYYFANGAAVSEVEIDTTTGENRLLRVDILQDVGNSLNPAIDLGQIEGAFIQGLGWLTTEELKWNDEGRLTSDGPATYKIPTAHDCPEIFNVNFYDAPNREPTVHRSKAVGEPPLMLAISAWCALRQACAAAGDRLPPLDAPATPEAIFMAVQAAQN